MDNQKVLEYINSSAIREHLRKLDYQLTPVQCALLVRQSERHTLKQRHEAWRDIIETMPDCAVEKRMNCRGWDSLHEMLRGYMALENKILSRFHSEEDAVYECEFWARSVIRLEAKDTPRGNECDWRTDNQRFRSFARCFEYALKKTRKEQSRFLIHKRYLETGSDSSSWEPYIYVEYDMSGEVLECDFVGSIKFYALSEEENDLWSESFDGMWFDIPIPFEKGDIVCDRVSRYKKDVPFVLLGTVPWYKKEHPSKHGTYYCDYSDMDAYGYSFDHDQQFFNDDFRVQYLNLEYYTEPLKGSERILYAYRQLERGEIDGYLFLKIYRMLMAEAAAEEERRHLQWCLPGSDWEKYDQSTSEERKENG